MEIDSAVLSAIDRCLSLGIPFFAARLPEDDSNVIFGADMQGFEPRADAPSFFIGQFNSPWNTNLWIRSSITASEASKLYAPVHMTPMSSTLPPATDKSQYLSSLAEVIANLRGRGMAKSVISMTRHCCLSEDKAPELFAYLAGRSQGCFAYICYDPSIGCWMGATPETLIKTYADGHFETMALAGTLPRYAKEWDKKNAMEHQIVVDYIMQKLSDIGATAQKEQRKSMNYGSIKHLCTPIHGTLGSVSAAKAYDALNPTPALCGYPKDAALADIAFAEKHQRGCYGGCVGLQFPDASVQAFVNIRCCRITSGHACCFGGGGITSDSSPESEWNEANAKIDNFLFRITP